MAIKRVNTNVTVTKITSSYIKTLSMLRGFKTPTDFIRHLMIDYVKSIPSDEVYELSLLLKNELRLNESHLEAYVDFINMSLARKDIEADVRRHLQKELLKYK